MCALPPFCGRYARNFFKKPRKIEYVRKAAKFRDLAVNSVHLYTTHIETLVVLVQKSASHIVMDVEFGEGEGQISLKEAKESAEEQKPKKKTTYKDIQR